MNGKLADTAPLFYIKDGERQLGIYQYLWLKAKSERAARADLTKLEKMRDRIFWAGAAVLVAIGIVLTVVAALNPKLLPSVTTWIYMGVAVAFFIWFLAAVEGGYSHAKDLQSRLWKRPHYKLRDTFITEDDYSWNVIVDTEGKLRHNWIDKVRFFLIRQEIKKADLLLRQLEPSIEQQSVGYIQKRYNAKMTIINQARETFGQGEYLDEMATDAADNRRSRLKAMEAAGTKMAKQARSAQEIFAPTA